MLAYFNLLLLDANSKNTWGEVIFNLLKSPMAFAWIIAILILLFVMSRMNNNLEVKSVNRAIVISRSIVGIFMWFFVAPIVVFLFINLFAVVNGIEMISAGFILDWIGLTFSSYWWILKCAFGSESISGQKDTYTLDSIVRILWISIPLAFIWLRTTKTTIMRLLLLPLILSFFIIARHKMADPCFITEGEGRLFLEDLPIIGNMIKGTDPSIPVTTIKKTSAKDNMKSIITFSVLASIVIGGIVIGLLKKLYIIGIIGAVVGIFGLILMAPSGDTKIIKMQHDEDHPINTNIDSLVKVLDSLITHEGESMKAYEVSRQINNALEAQHDFIQFPQELCGHKFRTYFYDWCD